MNRSEFAFKRIRLKKNCEKVSLVSGHFELCENQRFSPVFCFQAQDALSDASDQYKTEADGEKFFGQPM